MATLKAFICYRRQDAFMSEHGVDHDGVTLPDRIEAALRTVGFSEVFIDRSETQGVLATKHYESTSFKAIASCDLFIVLIGNKWKSLLFERLANSRRDAPAREIRAALNYEKEILPLFVDGAEMPQLEDLPEQIRRFHYTSGEAISSTSTSDTIAGIIAEAAKQVLQRTRIRRTLRPAYVLFAVMIYALCAITPNIVGLSEYGPDTWGGIIKIWGAFFIWPAVFLPFCLYALYEPIMTISESITSAQRIGEARIYMAPVLLAIILTVAGWCVEVLDPHQAPWTLSATAGSLRCRSLSRDPVDHRAASASLAGNTDRSTSLVNYDSTGSLRRYYSERGDIPFWLRDKCWPNVLFYLSSPFYENVHVDSYRTERPAIQSLFEDALTGKTGTPQRPAFSWTYTAYQISFALLFWLGMLGVVLAGFYMVARIRDPNSDEERTLPVDDAFMCLTYSLAILASWIPFRMHTEYVKYLYSCNDMDSCNLDVTRYMPDIMASLVLAVGYSFAIIGLITKSRRLLLSFVAALVFITCFAGSVCALIFKEEVARLAEYWQFYTLLSIPIVILFFTLWLMFDPDNVHFRDFRKDVY